MAIVWSCGGGLQSTAIGVLIRQGALPKPDLSGIADTGREKSATFEYLREHLQPYMDHAGVAIEILPKSLSTVDLYNGSGTLLIPAFTGTGRFPTYCSGSWKRDVMERWMRLKGVKTCTLWIGFSLDEMSRCSWKDRHKWCEISYPLIDLRLSKEGCKRIIRKAGLPLPPKSRCWCCPHQNAAEWREVKANPEEWAKACELDRQIRETDEENSLYLHSSRVPLESADLDKEPIEPPLFRQCQDAGCWT
jgi:hypothetical protein